MTAEQRGDNYYIINGTSTDLDKYFGENKHTDLLSKDFDLYFLDAYIECDERMPIDVNAHMMTKLSSYIKLSSDTLHMKITLKKLTIVYNAFVGRTPMIDLTFTGFTDLYKRYGLMRKYE